MFFSMNPAGTYFLHTLFLVLVSIILTVILKRARKLKGKKAISMLFASLLLVGAVLFSTGVFGRFVDAQTISKKTYTRKELLKDLQQLENCIINKNPLYFSDQAKLQQLFNSAGENIKDGMTELDFYRLVNPIIAAVNCGHTNLSISEALEINRKETAKFFPLKVTLVGNQLYILEDDPTAGITAGDEVISINGINSGEIIEKLIKNISGDGDYEAKRRYIISRHFNSRFYDFVDNSEEFHVILTDGKGRFHTALLTATYREEFNTNAWGLHFTDYRGGNYYQGRIEDGYAVLTVHLFQNEKNNKFASFLSDFFSAVQKKGIERLVIDLRGNFGGDSGMAKTLLSYLSAYEFDYFYNDLPLHYRLFGFLKPVIPQENVFKGDVVVLTDGAVFSTAAHFCALVKARNLGTLVGGKTGGTWVCTDAAKDTILKNTRMRLRYSTQTFKVLADSLPADSGVTPDIDMTMTIEDILDNRDPVMEAGLYVLQTNSE